MQHVPVDNSPTSEGTAMTNKAVRQAVKSDFSTAATPLSLFLFASPLRHGDPTTTSIPPILDSFPCELIRTCFSGFLSPYDSRTTVSFRQAPYSGDGKVALRKTGTGPPCFFFPKRRVFFRPVYPSVLALALHLYAV